MRETIDSIFLWFPGTKTALVTASIFFVLGCGTGVQYHATSARLATLPLTSAFCSAVSYLPSWICVWPRYITWKRYILWMLNFATLSVDFWEGSGELIRFNVESFLLVLLSIGQPCTSEIVSCGTREWEVAGMLSCRRVFDADWTLAEEDDLPLFADIGRGVLNNIGCCDSVLFLYCSMSWRDSCCEPKKCKANNVKKWFNLHLIPLNLLHQCRILLT